MEAAMEPGTGAVNAEGSVLLFVADADWADFTEFTVADSAIRLAAPGGASHERAYGPLTVEAARRTGRLTAVAMDSGGRPSAIAEVGARRGR